MSNMNQDGVKKQSRAESEEAGGFVYKDAYHQMWACIHPVRGCRTKVFCTVCAMYISIFEHGIEDITTHVEGTRHTEREAILFSLAAPNSRFASRTVREEVLLAEARWAMSVVEHNLTPKDGVNLAKECKALHPDYTVAELFGRMGLYPEEGNHK